MPEFDRDALAIAIRRIGWAYLLLHLNINLGSLNILPNWWGYLLIVFSLSALSQWSPSAKLLRPLGYFLAVADGIQWICKTLNVSLSSGPFQSVFVMLNLLVTLINLYFHFQLLTDIANAAQLNEYDGSQDLLRTRTWYTLLNTVLYLMLYASLWIHWLSVVLLVIHLVVAIIICRQILRFGKWLKEPFPHQTEI